MPCTARTAMQGISRLLESGSNAAPTFELEATDNLNELQQLDDQWKAQTQRRQGHCGPLAHSVEFPRTRGEPFIHDVNKCQMNGGRDALNVANRGVVQEHGDAY